MPVMDCESEGKPGFKFGEEGHCYTFTPGDEASRERARERAEEQGRAIEASRHRVWFPGSTLKPEDG